MTTVLTATLIASGLATSYAPDVMDEVVANRTRWGQLTPHQDHEGYIALLDCDRIGEVVWLERGHQLIPVMVADCAARHDREALIGKGFAVDLSYELAERFGVIDRPRGGFKVWDQRPETASVGAGISGKAMLVGPRGVNGASRGLSLLPPFVQAGAGFCLLSAPPRPGGIGPNLRPIERGL